MMFTCGVVCDANAHANRRGSAVSLYHRETHVSLPCFTLRDEVLQGGRQRVADLEGGVRGMLLLKTLKRCRKGEGVLGECYMVSVCEVGIAEDSGFAQFGIADDSGFAQFGRADDSGFTQFGRAAAQKYDQAQRAAGFFHRRFVKSSVKF